MHTVHKLWVSTSFQLLVEVNGPPKADNSKIIMVNTCVAFTRFHLSNFQLKYIIWTTYLDNLILSLFPLEIYLHYLVDFL